MSEDDGLIMLFVRFSTLVALRKQARHVKLANQALQRVWTAMCGEEGSEYHIHIKLDVPTDWTWDDDIEEVINRWIPAEKRDAWRRPFSEDVMCASERLVLFSALAWSRAPELVEDLPAYPIGPSHPDWKTTIKTDDDYFTLKAQADACHDAWKKAIRRLAIVGTLRCQWKAAALAHVWRMYRASWEPCTCDMEAWILERDYPIVMEYAWLECTSSAEGLPYLDRHMPYCALLHWAPRCLCAYMNVDSIEKLKHTIPSLTDCAMRGKGGSVMMPASAARWLVSLSSISDDDCVHMLQFLRPDDVKLDLRFQDREEWDAMSRVRQDACLALAPDCRAFLKKVEKS
jgi:hypothetical protein